MNDEIKEILDDIKDILSNKEVYDVEIDKEVLSLLLDYITNLQERIAYLERSNNRREDEIMSLRDENVDVVELKTRIEKAIESLKLKQIRYVNESDYVIDDGDLQEEINILQNGVDKDEK